MKILISKFHILFILVFFSHISFIASADDCTTERMDMLKRYVQEKKPETPELVKELLSCPDLKSEVIEWQSLYESFIDEPQAAKPVLPVKSGLPLININQNTTGTSEDVEKDIEQKNPNWRDDAEYNLTMARNYIKQNRYTKAQESYERYMKLKPDDFEVRTEIGTEFQEVNSAYALKNFNLLLTQAISEGQREEVELGLIQVDQARGLSPYTISTNTMREVYINHEQFSRSYIHFKRLNTNAGYQARDYSLEASNFVLSSDNSDTEQNASEVSAHKSFIFNNHKTALSLRLGWFQGVEGQTTGKSEFKHFFDSGFDLNFGAESFPWVKEAPIPIAFSHWTNKIGSIGFDYLNYLTYRFLYSTITDNGIERRHKLALNIPLIRFYPSGDLISLKAAGETYATDQPSIYYDAPERADIYKLGFSYEKYTLDGFILTLNADYALNYVTPHPSELANILPNQSTTGHTAEFAFTLGANITQGLSILTSLYYSEKRDVNENMVFNENSANLSIRWDFETKKDSVKADH